MPFGAILRNLHRWGAHLMVITVSTNMARATPLLGHEGPFGEQLGMTAHNDIRFALLSGSLVGGNALLRAYVWHCIGIPLIVIILNGGALLENPQGWRHFWAAIISIVHLLFN